MSDAAAKLTLSGKSYTATIKDGDTVELMVPVGYGASIYCFNEYGACNRLINAIYGDGVDIDYFVKRVYFNLPKCTYKAGYRVYEEFGSDAILSKMLLWEDDLALIETIIYKHE